MYKRIIALFLLSGLLQSCAPAGPTRPPVTERSPAASANPAPTQSHTLTPLASATLIRPGAPVSDATPTPPAGSDLVLERVAQLGGGINGITVVDDVAYVGMGPRVAAIDISRHERPGLIRQSVPLPGMVTQLLNISGGPLHLLLVNAGKYLVAIDPSKPGELKPLQQMELAGAISALVWDDRVGILYAGGSIYQDPNTYTGFISAVGITRENRLSLINTVAMPEQPQSLALSEEGLFAGAGGYTGGLYHVGVNTAGELSTPHGVLPSTPEKPLQPTSMQVLGERLYLSYRIMEAYDIADPAHPVQAWTEPGGMVGLGFSLAGEQIHVFGFAPTDPYTPQLHTITLSQPIAGSPIGEIASVTALHNGDFLVAYHDLEIYDTTDPQALQLVGSYQAPVTNVIGAAANGKAVFVVDNGVGDGRGKAILRVLNLPDLKPLGQVMTEIPNSWHWSTGNLQGIALDGDRLYLASRDSVWVYGVSRVEPNLLDKLEISGGDLETIAAIEIDGKRLLVTSQEVSQTSILTAYDLTDLQKPVRVSNPLSLDPGHISQMTWNGAGLFALLGILYEPRAMLYTIDLDNRGLVVKESLQLEGYVENLAADKQLSALVGADERLTRSFLLAVEAGPLNLLSQTTLPERGKGVALIGDRALVLAGDESGAAQLLAFDIQEAATPMQVGAMDIAASDNLRVPVLVTGPYVVLANGSGGVELLVYAGSP